MLEDPTGTCRKKGSPGNFLLADWRLKAAIQCWVPSVYAEDPSCSRIRCDRVKGTDRMRVAMVPTSQGDRASVRTLATSNGSYHNPYPLVTQGMWQAWFWDKFGLYLCIRIRSSVQAQMLSVRARLEGILTPSPWPSSVLVFLDHPEWCARRGVTEA